MCRKYWFKCLHEDEGMCNNEKRKEIDLPGLPGPVIRLFAYLVRCDSYNATTKQCEGIGVENRPVATDEQGTLFPCDGCQYERFRPRWPPDMTPAQQDDMRSMIVLGLRYMFTEFQRESEARAERGRAQEIGQTTRSISQESSHRQQASGGGLTHTGSGQGTIHAAARSAQSTTSSRRASPAPSDGNDRGRTRPTGSHPSSRHPSQRPESRHSRPRSSTRRDGSPADSQGTNGSGRGPAAS